MGIEKNTENLENNVKTIKRFNMDTHFNTENLSYFIYQ